MSETVLFSLIFAWLKGIKLSNIFRFIKNWSFYPILLTCFIHFYIIYLMINGEYWFIEYANYIKTASLLFYLCLVWKYKLFDVSIFKRISVKESPILTTVTSPITFGILCIWIGSILNIIAMKYNNLKMPVFPNVSYSTGYSKVNMFEKMLQYNDFHIIGDHTTNLIFLTDFIDFFVGVMSIGDIFTRIFVVLIIYYSIKSLSRI